MRLKRAINAGTAVLAAAIAPAVVFGLLKFFLTGIDSSFLAALIDIDFAFIVALTYAAIIGFPSYLILSRKRKVTCAISTFAGFIIGSVPTMILLFPYERGIPTLEGWMSHVFLFASSGFFGILGGFSFWLTLQILGKSNSADKHDFSFISLHVIFPLIVVIGSAAILMSPIISDLIYS